MPLTEHTTYTFFSPDCFGFVLWGYIKCDYQMYCLKLLSNCSERPEDLIQAYELYVMAPKHPGANFEIQAVERCQIPAYVRKWWQCLQNMVQFVEKWKTQRGRLFELCRIIELTKLKDLAILVSVIFQQCSPGPWGFLEGYLEASFKAGSGWLMHLDETEIKEQKQQ